jgi:hypothetical protein
MTRILRIGEQSPRRPGLSLSAARRKLSREAADYFAVNRNQTANPIDVRPFRPQSVMLEPHHIANLIEQFLVRLALGRGCVYKRINDSVFIGLP